MTISIPNIKNQNNLFPDLKYMFYNHSRLIVNTAKKNILKKTSYQWPSFTKLNIYHSFIIATMPNVSTQEYFKLLQINCSQQFKISTILCKKFRFGNPIFNTNCIQSDLNTLHIDSGSLMPENYIQY